MSIFPLRASGEGSSVSPSGMGCRHSMSPRMDSKYSAILVCWGMEQWFSMERITGYLGRGGGGGGRARNIHDSTLYIVEACPLRVWNFHFESALVSLLTTFP